jgi:hypothetical protein
MQSFKTVFLNSLEESVEGMSEVTTFSLVASFTSAVIAAVALVMSIINYNREKPNLKIEKVEVTHNFTHNPSEPMGVNFWARFWVNNLGDRPTRINETVLEFNNGIKDALVKRQDFFRMPLESDDHRHAKSVLINAHDSTYFQVQFIQPFNGPEREQISCNLKVMHTHGSKTVKSTSALTKDHLL